jgi:peptide/nickel transport system permease protein
VARAEAPLRQAPDRRLRARLPLTYFAGWHQAVLAVVAGAGLVWLGTRTLHRATAVPRWALGLLGVLLLARGIDRALKSAFGARCETGFWCSLVWIGLLVVLAVIAGLLPLQKPTALPLRAPAFVRPDLFSSRPLGTDGFGRDYLSRIIYGARVSLVLGVGCVVAGGSIGTAIGLLAGYFRGKPERVLDIIIDVLLAFPPLVFLLALVAVLRPSVVTEFIALSVLTLPTFARLSKASTLTSTTKEYVLAARAIGRRDLKILWRDVVPNVVPPLMSYAMAIVAALMIAEASLSFLGLGVQPPQPSWGNMIAQAEPVLQHDPHALLVPSAVLFVTVLAFNRLGEAARTRREFRDSQL